MRRLKSWARWCFQGDGSRATSLFCALIALVAVWHALDFSHDFDPEYPGLNRDHYSRYAPFAYRLSEPGDTLDLTTLYLSSVGIGLSMILWVRRDRNQTCPAETSIRTSLFGLCLAGFWIGAAPDPTPDGWHGLAWQAITRVSTPLHVKLILSLFAVMVLSLTFYPITRLGRTLYKKTSHGWRCLALLAGICFCWRITNWPDPEPWGYWSRWAMILTQSIVLGALLGRFQALPPIPTSSRRKVSKRLALSSLSLVFLVIQAGFYLHWLHWPIPRFKVVIPGQIYVSAMPPPSGLALANDRHHFKTIINLFNEDTPLRHPNFPAELAYAESHGIRYIRAQGKSYGSAYVQSTFDEVRKPENWPVLVHCHGNMDRTPAWLGMYRFIDQSWSLADVLAAIERHRGYRPKGGTTILYNDVLPILAPDRWATDPTAKRLVQNAHGIKHQAELQAENLADKQTFTLRK
ncbi:MAG: protein tyrosine phosphatase [Planctomycetota bacterium]